MSTPAEDEPDELPGARRRSRLETLGFVFVALSVGTVFIVALFMESAGGGPNLQLVTPYAAIPGREMAVRASLFVPDHDVPGGVRSTATTVSLALVDREGAVVARGELVPSPPSWRPPEPGVMGADVDTPTLGMEGVIAVPSTARDELVLRAEAPLDDGSVARCQAPIRVSRHPRVPEPRGHPIHPLDQYRQFPIEPVGEAQPPNALDLRVIGGACVPSEPCHLSAWVGAPAASVRLEPHPPVTLLSSAEATAPTDGIVRFDVRIDGPEAEVELVAARDGVDVARRRVRLPLLLGGVPLEGTFGLLDGQPEVVVPAHEAVIVDAFRDRLWERTTSASAPTGVHARAVLPEDALHLDPGLWRVQMRTDPFGADSAGVRFAYLRADTESDAHALRQIKRRLEREGADDALTPRLPLPGVEPRLQAEHALALLEMDVIQPPAAMSGAEQRDSTLDEHRVRVRWLAVAVIVAVALFVAGYMLRRGLVAAREARDVLTMAGDREARSRRSVVSMTLRVVAIVALVVLAFVSVAILLLARGA